MQDETSQNASPTVWVSDKSARAVLDWPSTIEVIRKTYSVAHTRESPLRVMAWGKPGPKGPTWMRTLTGLDPAGPYMGVKQFGLSRQRRVNYLISLFDRENGDVVALLDGNGITALRTAATTAVALDCIAPRGADTLGVIGSGHEAYTHVRAAHHVRPLKGLTVYSRTPENREAFAKAFEAETGVKSVAVDSPEKAVSDKAVVIGATAALGDKPVIEGRWLSPQTILASIGATTPVQHEIDAQAISQAGVIVCDVPEEVTKETGCFIDAHKQGVNFEDKIVSLNDLVLGRLEDRLAGARYKMYRSVGGPLQDVSVATLAFQRCLEAGTAQPLPISFNTKG